MHATRDSNIFIATLFVLLAMSIAAAYYQYMIRQNFQYFTTEEQIPDRFNAASYE